MSEEPEPGGGKGLASEKSTRRRGATLEQIEEAAKLANAQLRYRSKRRGVVRINDQSRDLVGFIGDNGILQESPQGRVSELHLRPDASFRGVRGDAR